MAEIKGIILNGTQYGLEDETTLETANSALKMAENNANDITTLETSVKTAQTTAETAQTTAETAQTTATNAQTTATNALAKAEEAQSKQTAITDDFLVYSSQSIELTDEQELEMFGKKFSEWQSGDKWAVFQNMSINQSVAYPLFSYMEYKDGTITMRPKFLNSIYFEVQNNHVVMKCTRTDGNESIFLTIPIA